MTILNQTNDGSYPDLIVLYRAAIVQGTDSSENLVRICSPSLDSLKRLRAVLSRWRAMGLFEEINNELRLKKEYGKRRGQTLDKATLGLSKYCCELILDECNSMPLWGKGVGVAGDFSAGISWLLAQDIYSLPSAWGGIDPLLNRQSSVPKKLIENDTRWSPLRQWARYLGFAEGEGSNFLVDPTRIISLYLPQIFSKTKSLPAGDFLSALSTLIPVLDSGKYRNEVEATLDKTHWRSTEGNSLSMSLSLALRRLELSGELQLLGKADAGSSYSLTGAKYRFWKGFESVVWRGGK